MTESSLRFTRAGRINGDVTSATQYLRGRNTRTEDSNSTYISNKDLGYSFQIEPARHIYTALRVNEHGSPVWAKPSKMAPVTRSGKTVENYIETVDTGERKELFGYAARRVITRTRQTRESQPMSESECDGWYVDPPAAWSKQHPPLKAGGFVYITTSGNRDDYKFSETGKRENGFALFTRRVHKSIFENYHTGRSETRESVHIDEVTEISEAPLAPDLFVPPHDFKQVPHLDSAGRQTLKHHLRLRWELFKDSRQLPSKIAAFLT